MLKKYKEIKEIKGAIDKTKQEHQFVYDDDNRLIIDMEIQNDDYFLDEFSRSDYPIISTDIAEYILKYTTALKHKEKFTLRIHSNCIDDNEKIIYSKAIKNYYINKYLEDNTKLKNNRKTAWFLGAFGALVLALVIILEYSNNSVFWMRVFDIVAWVFLWESIDILAFQCKELRMSQIRDLAFIDMKIEFIEL